MLKMGEFEYRGHSKQEDFVRKKGNSTGGIIDFKSGDFQGQGQAQEKLSGFIFETSSLDARAILVAFEYA